MQTSKKSSKFKKENLTRYAESEDAQANATDPIAVAMHDAIHAVVHDLTSILESHADASDPIAVAKYNNCLHYRYNAQLFTSQILFTLTLQSTIVYIAICLNCSDGTIG